MPPSSCSNACPGRCVNSSATCPRCHGGCQEDATALRARLSELQDALTACGDAENNDARRELRAARDAAQARLTDAIAALETIRLDILRLHVDADAVVNLTTQLGIAAEVSAEVRRLVSARMEMDAVLAFPRGAAATPV